ncbi:hypothetical protein WJX72_004826 [[Myrmecia] bisecta]|uniref:C3H1-type domain-containing protein n=1 Tax=[Myrmecia] bisecta TaxID=41462 RepID=A0AAW1QF78_9CHLO
MIWPSKLVLREFAKGARPKAKKALQKLAKDFPTSPLPHRYLARLLYHEAVTLEGPDTGTATHNKRLQLLREALDCAGVATDLCPASLSCAALRATLVVNKTCDPCCLRIQDKVHALLKEEKWDELLLEKRNVLISMRQVLESCYTLLDSTQIPVDGIVRLLQHILRPHQQELQVWASQLLLGKGLGLEHLQKQATISEMMKLMKPADALQPVAGVRGASANCAPSLSIEREWDGSKDLVGLARRKGRGKGTERRSERTPQERFNSVKDFWGQLAVNRKQQMLRVPVQRIMEVVKKEQGLDATEDVAEGLSIMRSMNNRRACYWHCPCCDARFNTAKQYSEHTETFHEEVQQLEDGSTVSCAKCTHEVVGMYYTSRKVPTYHLCLRCYHEEVNGNQNPNPELHPFDRIQPQGSAVLHAWSETSDFLSTKDSFCSLDEEYGFPSIASHASGGFPGGSASLDLEDWNQAGEAGRAVPLAFIGEIVHATDGMLPVVSQPQTHAQGHAQSQSLNPRQSGSGAQQGASVTEMGSENGGSAGPSMGNGTSRSSASGAAQFYGSDFAAGSSELSEDADLTDEGSSWRDFFPKQFKQWHSAAASKISSLVAANNQAARQNGQLRDPGPAGFASGSAAYGAGEAAAAASQPAPAAAANAQPSARASPANGPTPNGLAGSHMRRGGSHPEAASSPARLAAGQDVTTLASISIMDDIDSSIAIGLQGYSEQQMVESIIHHINALWQLDQENFEATLNSIVAKATQMLRRRAELEIQRAEMQRSGAEASTSTAGQALLEFVTNPNIVLQRPDHLQLALTHLPARDLQSLLNYILTCTPAALGLTTASERLLGDASSSDGLAEIDLEEESGAPPLFQWASPPDAYELERVADEIFEVADHLRFDRHEAYNKQRAAQVAEPAVVVQPWWLDHLLEKGWEAESQPEAGGSKLRILRWIYGNVVNATAEEFCERQREVLGSREREVAILDLYEDVAYTWRSLFVVQERKRSLSALREAARSAFHAVKRMEDRGLGATKAAACEYLDMALAPYPAQTPAGQARINESAVKQFENQQALTSDHTLRYAKALIERELAALDLEEAMLAHEGEESEHTGAAAEERVGKARSEVAEAEAELARVQQEGPANHRKRDILDKATKEAEHRERLVELKQRIDASKARITTEEADSRAAKERGEAAQRELLDVRQQLQQLTDRKKQLESVCAQMDAFRGGDSASEVDMHNQMQQFCYRILWVSEAIRLFADRYTPQAGGQAYEHFMRASQSAKQLADDFEDTIRKYWADLDKLRAKLQDAACIDLAGDVNSAALEIVRQQVEDAAREAKEAATTELLRELEAEEMSQQEAAKRAAEAKKQKKSKAKQKTDKAKGGKGAKDADAPPSKQSAAELAEQQRGETEAARLAAEAEYEAALEQRRREVELEHAKRDIEQLRLLDELSRSTAQRSAASGAALPGEAATARGSWAASRTESLTADQESVSELSEDGRSGTAGESTADSVAPASGDADFDAALRLAIEASLKDQQQRSGQSPGQDWQPVGGRDASAGAAAAADPKKKKNRKQRAKENRDKEKEAAEQPAIMRIVSYYGDWVCECGLRSRLWDTCECGRVGPCRDWVRGRCAYETCRFAHPPFDLPPGPPPPSPIARPTPATMIGAHKGTPAAPAGAQHAQQPAKQQQQASAPSSATSAEAPLSDAQAEAEFGLPAWGTFAAGLMQHTQQAQRARQGAHASAAAAVAAQRSHSSTMLADQPLQDIVVPPPRRTPSANPLVAQPSAQDSNHLPLPVWSQIGGWGPTAAAGEANPFNPFASNPLQRALAADYRRDPVVQQPSVRRQPSFLAPLSRPLSGRETPEELDLQQMASLPLSNAPLGSLVGPAAMQQQQQQQQQQRF